MGRGIFHRTFYCPEAPTHLDHIDFDLTNNEQGMVDRIFQTETITRLDLEFGCVGDGMAWNKDHFELIPNYDVDNYLPLNQHCKFKCTLLTVTLTSQIFCPPPPEQPQYSQYI